MDLNSEIMAAVHGAVHDALLEAQDHWEKTPQLSNTAMLTDASLNAFGSGAEAEITFETHAQVIPQTRRYQYGAAAGIRGVKPARMHGPRASVQTLMQDTEQTLEEAFRNALDSRTGWGNSF